MPPSATISQLVVGSSWEVVLRINAKSTASQFYNGTSYFSVAGNDSEGSSIEVKCLNADGLHSKIRLNQVLRFGGYVCFANKVQGSMTPSRKVLLYDASSTNSYVNVVSGVGIPYSPVPEWWEDHSPDVPGLPLKVPRRTLEAPGPSSSNQIIHLGKQDSAVPSLEELTMVQALQEMEERDNLLAVQKNATYVGFLSDGWGYEEINAHKDHKKAALDRINDEFYLWRAWVKFGGSSTRMVRCLAVISLVYLDGFGQVPLKLPAFIADILHAVIGLFCKANDTDLSALKSLDACCHEPDKIWCKTFNRVHPFCKVCHCSIAYGTKTPVCSTMFAHDIKE